MRREDRDLTVTMHVINDRQISSAMDERAPTADDTVRIPHGKNWEPLNSLPLRAPRRLRVVCIGVGRPIFAELEHGTYEACRQECQD